MDRELLDLYSDYLISQTQRATATGLSDLLNNEISHDRITRFLHSGDFGSKELWQHVKPYVRAHEDDEGVLLLDDSVEEKAYTDENEIISWHYSHGKNRTVKGINFLSCLVRYGDISFPIGYDVIKKDVRYCDIETKKEKRKSSVTKNELFRELITNAKNNKIKYNYILADNWFSAKDNMEFIHIELSKKFIFGLKSNRTVALSRDDKKNGQFQKISSLDLEENQAIVVWLKGIAFPIQLAKKVFTNKDGSTGILYLATNDLSIDADRIFNVYQKRWRIEEFHKSIKQNASFAKSPTRRARSQCNHIFACMISYCKLESIKIKTKLNHFAIKYKLIMKANQNALRELHFMNS